MQLLCCSMTKIIFLQDKAHNFSMYRKQLYQHFLPCARSSQIGPVFYNLLVSRFTSVTFCATETLVSGEQWLLVGGGGGRLKGWIFIPRFIKKNIKPILSFLGLFLKLFISKINSNLTKQSGSFGSSHYLKYCERNKCFLFANLSLG